MDPDEKPLIIICPTCHHAINQHDADGCHQYIGDTEIGTPTCECLWTPNTIAFWHLDEEKRTEMERTQQHVLTTEKLTECPACGKDITMQVQWNVALELEGKVQTGTVQASLTPAGVRVNHDCIPKTMRSVPRGAGL